METTRERHESSLSVSEMGFKKEQVIQEFGWDEDVDEDLRQALMDQIEDDLQDEDFTAMTDGALIWWRDDDGGVDDLSDALMDAMGNMDEGGLIWVLSPIASDPGAVDPRLIEEAAKTAGMNPTTSDVVSPQWAGTQIVSRGR
ncbi:DUF3052 domain-containing protein [Varibaculum cambriense]|uniref:DUF3052 domain-containing protein n=1 Tax=Varibaculum cambriense TaxID=184870 RepID=UPI00241D27BE|nr:DUF3052 domain-containing protein [Varibaculum cambriense]